MSYGNCIWENIVQKLVVESEAVLRQMVKTGKYFPRFMLNQSELKITKNIC